MDDRSHRRNNYNIGRNGGNHRQRNDDNAIKHKIKIDAIKHKIKIDALIFDGIHDPKILSG